MMSLRDSSRTLPDALGRRFMKRTAACVLLASATALLGGCGLFGSKPAHVPTPLTTFQQSLNVQQVWTASVGKAGSYYFEPLAVGDSVYAAGVSGTIIRVDAGSGKVTWTAKAGTDISAGPGSDGEVTAVGTVKGEVLAFDHTGKQIWKGNAGSEVLTAPLVGHGLVIARAINNRITAFDAQTGAVRWIFQQPNVPLTLRTGSSMIFVGDHAMVTGFPGGQLASLDLNNGSVLWGATLSLPQGVTEVERINDVTGTPTLFGRQICAVTFQGRIGCVDAITGNGLWARAFSSSAGLSQDGQIVASTNTQSQVFALDSSNGDTLWHNDKLMWRGLSAPLILGPTVVVGDDEGYLHFLSRDKGDFIARVKTDSSGIRAQPVLVGDTLVVQTRDGELFAYRPK